MSAPVKPTVGSYVAWTETTPFCIHMGIVVGYDGLALVVSEDDKDDTVLVRGTDIEIVPGGAL